MRTLIFWRARAEDYLPLEFLVLWLLPYLDNDFLKHLRYRSTSAEWY